MAWTVVETCQVKSLKLGGGEVIVRVKLVCTADASGAIVAFSDATLEKIKGSYLYGVWTKPAAAGDAPSGVYAIEVTDEDSLPLLTLTTLSASVTKFTLGSDTLSVFPPILDTFTITYNDQIGNGNIVTTIFYFLK